MPFLKFSDESADPNVGFYGNSQQIPAVSKLGKIRRFRWVIAFALFIIVVSSVLIWYFVTKQDAGSLIPQFKEMEGDMNKNIKPCNDFYEYSCGKYILRYSSIYKFKDKFSSLSTENKKKTKAVMDSMSQTSDPFFRKAYMYYKSCMTSSRSMDPYFVAADAIGGSDITTVGKFDYSSWNLETTLQKMALQYNTNPLFSVRINADLSNTSRNIIMISQPDIAILTKLASEEEMGHYHRRRSDEVLEDDIDVISSFVSKYSNNVRDRFIRDVRRRTSNSYFFTQTKVLEATEFQSTLISDIKDTFKDVIVHKMYKVIPVSELYKITGYEINWIKFLQSLFPSNKSVRITNESNVGLMVPENYLAKVKRYLKEEKRKLPNFFAWVLLKKLSPVLPDDYFAAYFFQSTALDIGSTRKERWRACIMDTETNLPMSVGMMFTKAVVSSNTTNKTLTMLKEVQNAFEVGSGNLTWLDEKTKKAVVVKIKSVIDIISGPNLFQDGWLNSAYKTVSAQSDNLAAFFLSCQRNIVRMKMKKISEKPSREEWDLSSPLASLYDVNAFYYRTRNSITVLSGIMKQPFMYGDGPNYINFAKIGAILGHELLHGFDSKGWYYNKDGQIAPWWSPGSAKGFDARAKCVASQYSNYLSGNTFVDGKKTLAENIADNAGLKYAFHAYKNWASKNPNERKPPGLQSLSYDRLFFIGYAQMWCRVATDFMKDQIAKGDTHSPNRYRVIGSVSNFPEFAKAFNCPMGSKMNPAKKCEFW